jgi:hypothetical protein
MERESMAREAISYRDPAYRRGGGELTRVVWRRVTWAGIGIEAFLLALFVVAPVGGVTQTISPLARAWPWLLWPARVVFGPTLVNASLGPEQGWPALALFATLLVGASVCWGLAVWPQTSLRSGKKPRPDQMRSNWGLWLALGGALVMGLTLALLPSLPSDDVFSYILYGRISAVHGANPLVATPVDFPNDPFLSLVYWQTTRSVYGPVWLALSAGVTALAQSLGGSLATYVALFKLLGLTAHLVNVALVWAILGRFSVAPQRRLAGTLLYAWCPLTLLEFCASSHNDAVMLMFLLAGVYAFARAKDGDWRWEAVGLALVGLAIATKFTPIALLPLYGGYVIWRARARGANWTQVSGALAWRAGVVALVQVVAIAPYWAGPQTIDALLFSPPAQQLDNSLIEAVSWPLRWVAQSALGMSLAQAKSLAETALKAVALLVFIALWLTEFRRTRTLTGTLTAWAWALLWYALIASGWFWPWYVTWVVALAAVAPWGERGRLQAAAALMAGGALTLYGFIPLQAAPIYGFRSFVAFGPVVAYLGYQIWRSWRNGSIVRPDWLVSKVEGLISKQAAEVPKSGVIERS